MTALSSAPPLGRAIEAALGAAEAAEARAAAAGTLREESLSIAGLPVRLRLAARGYGPVVDLALAHRRAEAPAAPPRPFTIHVVDESEVAVPLPPDVLRATCFDGGAPRAEGPLRAHMDVGLETVFVADLERGLAVHWHRDARRLPWWAAAAPLRAVLSWALAPLGARIVHAGAVGTAAGAALLAGKSGSGKSTTSLACLDGGELLFAGDDHVAVEVEGAGARVHSLYATAKLRWDHAPRFPRLAPLISNVHERDSAEKALLRLHPGAADRLGTGLPVRALLLPRVAADRPETRVLPASRAEALLALAPTTLLQIPGAAAEALLAMRAVVERAPAFHLLLGSDVERIPAAIVELLARLGPAPAPAHATSPAPEQPHAVSPALAPAPREPSTALAAEGARA